MKKYISILIIIVLFAVGIIAYNKHDKNIAINCSSNQSEIDSYVSKVLAESGNYNVQENELDRQATDGSYRRIFTDKNNDVVLIEDKHSGETGFRTVSVVLKDKKVVKVIDELTSYKIAPIEDPASVPTMTKDEFYVVNSSICTWYKEGKLTDQITSPEKEYINVINGIILDAENVARNGVSSESQ
ncbi:MAG: hypothetical protein KBC67_00500 [Candidatus Pacebacteria bacterium]|nr:hypothetical protein [Candidatus Paceibacterota bacterium]